MAQKSKVSIIIDAKDRAGRVLRKLQKQIGGLTKRAAQFATGGAVLGGILGGVFTRSTIKAASTSEDLRLRLDALLGSTEEGGKAFEKMAEFAATVPFAFEEIMNSSAQLAGIVSGGADEIAGLMPMIADLAAVSGLTIQQTTEQVVRMFAAGAGAADRFRERGVLAMLGFKAGVKTSAEETKRTLIAAFEDPESKFRGASAKMASTWTGLTSMLGDRWFQFRNMVADAGIFDRVKEGLEGLLARIDEAVQSGELALWAEAMSDAAIKAIDAISTVFDFFGTLVQSLRPDLIEAAPGLISVAQLDDLESATRLANVYAAAVADLEEEFRGLEEQANSLGGKLREMLPKEIEALLPEGAADRAIELKAELDGLKLVYDALVAKIGELRTAEESGGGGGTSPGDSIVVGAEAAGAAWDKYEEKLTQIAAKSALLGSDFDAVGETLKAQATLIDGIAASGLGLNLALSDTRVSLADLTAEYLAHKTAAEATAAANEALAGIYEMAASAVADARTEEEQAVEVKRALAFALDEGKISAEGFVKAMEHIEKNLTGKLEPSLEGAEKVVEHAKRSFEQLGADLILGLASGANDAKDVFLSTLKSIFSLAIQIGIRAILPFSPSHRSRPWGRSLIQGMTAGIEDEAPKMLRTWADAVSGFEEPTLGFPRFATPSFTAPTSETQFEASEPMRLTIEGPSLPAPTNPLAAARDDEWQRFYRESALVAEGEGFRARAN